MTAFNILKSKDIRMKLFNFSNPICEKMIGRKKLKIYEGRVVDKKKTYILSLGREKVGTFNSVQEAKDFKILGELFARKCSVTGKGMDSGFCFDEGVDYAIDKKSAMKLARDRGYKSLKASYNDEAHYWTEWEMPIDAQYQMINGVLTEL